jgi:GNAT superfamily N-acetyltransferase
MICDIVPIQAANVADFLHLTSPQDADRLRQIDRSESIAALGATVFAQPVGLIYALPTSRPRTYMVASFYVAPKFRQRGIGTALLQALTQHLTARNACDALALSYTRPTNTPATPCVALLKKFGDHAPTLTQLIVTTDAERYLQAPWHHTFRFSPGYRCFFWRETTAAQRAAFQAQFGAQPCFPQELSPFVWEDRIEPLNSVGLTYHDRLVGWMITERLNVDAILYARAYVVPELQHFGKYFWQLVYEAVNAAYQQRVNQGVFTVDPANTHMRQLVYRRMRSYVNEIRERYLAFINTRPV